VLPEVLEDLGEPSMTDVGSTTWIAPSGCPRALDVAADERRIVRQQETRFVSPRKRLSSLGMWNIL
jgi:hypothetical protein